MVLVRIDLRVKDSDYRRFHELKRRISELEGRYVTNWEVFRKMLDLLEKYINEKEREIRRIW